MNKLVSIVIVTCNRLDFTRKTLESIFANTDYPNYEIIVLDNQSMDGTVEYLEKIEKHPQVSHVIYFKSNQGKGRAANLGFRLAKGDYLIGLDDDVLVPKGWLSKMINAINAVPNIGWLCMNFENLSQEIFTPETERKFGKITIQTPHAVGGQCVAMPRTTFEQIGGYIESTYYGGVDSEYNMRAKKYGLLTGYVIDVVGYHLGGTKHESEQYPDYFKYKTETQNHLLKGNKDLAKTNYFANDKFNLDASKVHANLSKGQLLKASDAPAVYFVLDGVKHEIPSLEVFEKLHFSWSKVKIISLEEIKKLPTGNPLRI